jgi:hypothetical protein
VAIRKAVAYYPASICLAGRMRKGITVLGLVLLIVAVVVVVVLLTRYYPI